VDFGFLNLAELEAVLRTTAKLASTPADGEVEPMCVVLPTT
jgi:hypothetical protein